ncbi:hypothetical protein GSI_01375 [Ganoderma sinense ZZ0214-1]|uniref:Uncharacterized protein n=1 Tax=Ganoderma sinense ZZ0214-1 TaxID=1077348 RepID=A0A2G8SV91_9APHY|nr:hypothetical protein GSI_01375 [Ganoderma sinense ZZ0214-1]
MITLVLPAGDFFGAPVGLFYQWTVDAKGVAKRNQVDVGTFSAVEVLKDGTGVGVFKASFYTYEFTFPADEKPVTIKMSACDSLGPHTISFERATCGKSPAGCKKALIARFDDGSDTGIFMVKEMPTKYLGFEAAHVEMLRCNVDVANSAKSFNGCHPTPTVVHFKVKFVEMLAGAPPGDVRFLYVDAHGMQKCGGDGCDQDHGKNGCFAFA